MIAHKVQCLCCLDFHILILVILLFVIYVVCKICKSFDSKKNFVSVEIRKGIHHTKSANYWPRSNREVQHYNRTLLKSICPIYAEGKDW